jgi:hypothetical protein
MQPDSTPVGRCFAFRRSGIIYLLLSLTPILSHNIYINMSCVHRRERRASLSHIRALESDEEDSIEYNPKQRRPSLLRASQILTDTQEQPIKSVDTITKLICKEDLPT